MNGRVDIRKDIKRYQETLSCASSRVNYSVGENIYMLSSDINLNISSETVGYNNKILVSNGTFSLGKNSKINTLELVKISHKVVVKPTITPHKQTTSHNEEKLPWYFLWLGSSEYGTPFDKTKDKTQVRVIR